MALSSGPADPVPELRVAAGVATLLVFDAPLDRGSLVLEGRERFRLVDAGDRALVLEPALDLGPGERLGLRVRYAGSATPEQAGFTLTTHASEVDTRVEVFRRNDSVELLRAELVDLRAQLKAQTEENQGLRALRDSSGPAGLIIADLIDYKGVQAKYIQTTGADGKSNSEGALRLRAGMTFRAKKWAVISLKVRNHGTKAWSPGSANVANARSGARLGVRSVRSELPQIEPNEIGLVVVETEGSPWPPGEIFSVELLDRDGSVQMFVPRVVL